MRALVVLLFLFPSLAWPLSVDEPFGVDLKAGEVRVAPGGRAELAVRYEVLKDHFVYRDMSAVQVSGLPAGVTAAEAVFPKGERKHDSVSDSVREIYESSFDVTLPITVAADVAAGRYPVSVQVRWQGCNKPDNYCLFPGRKELAATLVVSTSKKAAWRIVPEAHAEGGKSWAPPGVDMAVPEVDFSQVPASADVREEADDPHPVRARLLADHAVVPAGQPFRLGVLLSPDEHWHTYWLSPGDIGLPTRIEWGLPEGSSHTEFAYPRPERFDDSGIVSYGYSGPVLFFTEVTLPGSASGEVTVTADAKWLVCKTSCIPGEARLELPLQVGNAEVSPQAPLFDHFAARHPSPRSGLAGVGAEGALSVGGVHSEGDFSVAVRLVAPGKSLEIVQEDDVGTWPAVVPIAKVDGMLLDSKLEVKDGALTARLDFMAYEVDELPTDQFVGALLQAKVDGHWVATEVRVPVPWAGQGVAAAPNPAFYALVGEDLPAASQPEAVTAMASAGAPPDGASSAPVAAEASAAPITLLTWVWALLGAFFGGLILNVMPCVLPVLTMKLYSLVEQKGATDADRRLAGLTYTAGVLVSFLALGLALVIAKVVFGTFIAWGIQNSNPIYLATLGTLVFVFGLSLFGVFEVPALGASQAAQASAKEGLAGHFLTGVFATLLATPCTAPMLGSAMGFAFTLPPAGILLFFGVVGLGMAFPFLLVPFVPAAFSFLPRPGGWMDTFKQVMGFTLIATTVWLADSLAKHLSDSAMTGYWAFLIFVGFGCWLMGRFGSAIESYQRQVAMLAVALLVSALGGWVFLDLSPSQESGVVAELEGSDTLFAETWEEIPWQPFSEENVAELKGKPVFIDFTADWCLTCKVNENTILATARVKDAMREKQVVPLKADWTKGDETITQWLSRHGKSGVPMYLVLPADERAETIVLPEVITADLVVDALEKAAACGEGARC